MKEQILKCLKDNYGIYVSGEVLSARFGVSRTAIWKYINELKEEGYNIDSSSRKGYKLGFAHDLLNAFEVMYGLNTEIIGRDVHHFSVLDSTNNYAKKLASEGCREGTVVVADKQTAGKGRLGRTWDSMDRKGIWMSVVLRPDAAPDDVQLITLAASVAVVSAIRTFAGVDTGIKWPNDIVLKGKKLCGILTEMSSEIDKVNYLVLGIGLNVNQEKEDFPESISDTAISLRIHKDESAEDKESDNIFDRSSLIKGILAELEKEYKKIISGDIKTIVDEWKSYSVTMGREVRVTVKGNEYTGMAVDITSDGKLVVNCNDGLVREVLSGEVLVRGLFGYI